MKELFNKLSNSFNFFNEKRLVNVGETLGGSAKGSKAERPEGEVEGAAGLLEKSKESFVALESKKITESDILDALDNIPNEITGKPTETHRLTEDKINSAKKNARNNVWKAITKAFVKLPKGTYTLHDIEMKGIEIRGNPTSINDWQATIYLTDKQKKDLAGKFAEAYNKQATTRLSQK